MKKRSSPRWNPTTPPVRRICHGSTPRNPTVSPRPVWILANPLGTPYRQAALSRVADYLRRVFYFGGLKTNAEAQVLNMDGDAIPGLYAAGETMGIYYRTYTGATSVMRGAVFGRKAGSDAANRFARANTV